MLKKNFLSVLNVRFQFLLPSGHLLFIFGAFWMFVENSWCFVGVLTTFWMLVVILGAYRCRLLLFSLEPSATIKMHQKRG